MRNAIQKYDTYFVALWGILLFIPFLGSVHLFDWDEVNFAESAREMLVSGNYQRVTINFLPFMEKPPLFFWLQALSMKLFGVNEFAARLPNAIVGIVTLLFVFQIGKKWFSTRLALLWVLMITGSLTPHLYYKTGIIDPLYNLFIFAAIYRMFLYVLNPTAKHAVIMGTFLGFAIITKGPVAVLVTLLCFFIYWSLQKFKRFFEYQHLLYVVLSALGVSALWFGPETLQNGPKFLLEFIKYQIDLFVNPVAGHGQPFYYHPVVLLLGCFPASVFAMPMLFKRNLLEFGSEKQVLINFMLLLFWVVLILFSIVETKIVHYSSLCYLPLTFLAAQFMDQWQEAKLKCYSFQIILFGTIGIILSTIFIVLPEVDYFKSELLPYIKDEFAKASLMVEGNWLGYEGVLGILLLTMVLYYVVMMFRKQLYTAGLRFLIFNSFVIPCLLVLFAPKIERYSQGPAIQFFESLQAKDVYVETLGYKSYAQYFYSRTPQHTNSNASNTQWLLSGQTDKDAYFSVHCNNTQDHVNSSMIELKREGGFIFYVRPAADSTLKSIVKP